MTQDGLANFLWLKHCDIYKVSYSCYVDIIIIITISYSKLKPDINEKKSSLLFYISNLTTAS